MSLCAGSVRLQCHTWAQGLPPVKNPLLLHPPLIRGAREVGNAPVGPGKEQWDFPLGQGSCSCSSSPPARCYGAAAPQEMSQFTPVPNWCDPLAVPGLCFCPHLLRLGVSASSITSLSRDPGPAGIPVQQGSLHSCRALFPFPSPHPGWQSLRYLRVGGETGQADRESGQ